MQQVGNAVRDGQAETEALAIAAVATVEFLEHHGLLLRRDAGAAVMHADRQCLAVPANAQQHAATTGVADGIGQEVLQHPAQQQRVAVHPRAGRHMAELQAARRCKYSELLRKRIQHGRQRERARIGHQATGFQPRDIQQARQQIVGGIQRAANLAQEAVQEFRFDVLRHGVGQQLRRMQGLDQVMADRGQEAGLGHVGPLGFMHGLFKPGGAVLHAALQGFVTALERVLCQPERGDIGEGGHIAATGHRVASDLNDGVVRENPLGKVRRAAPHVHHPPLQRLFARVTRGVADLQLSQRPRRQVRHRLPHLQQLRRELEQRGVAAVPGHQLQLRIDHADALAHVLQGSLQQALVEAQYLGGFTDRAGNSVQRRCATIACRLHQQPRHACTDHGGQFALDGGHPVVVQHLPGVPVHQLPCPFLAEEATGGLAQ